MQQLKNLQDNGNLLRDEVKRTMQQADDMRRELMKQMGEIAAKKDLREKIERLKGFKALGQVIYEEDGKRRNINEVLDEAQTQYRDFCDTKMAEALSRAGSCLEEFPKTAASILEEAQKEFDAASPEKRDAAEALLDTTRRNMEKWDVAAAILADVIQTQPDVPEKRRRLREARDIYPTQPDVLAALVRVEEEADTQVFAMVAAALRGFEARFSSEPFMTVAGLTLLEKEIIEVTQKTLAEVGEEGRKRSAYTDLVTEYGALQKRIGQRTDRRRQAEAQIVLAKGALREGDKARALRALDAINAADKTDPQVQALVVQVDSERDAAELYALAEADLKRGDYESAATRFKRYKEKGGDATKADAGVMEATELTLLEQAEENIANGNIEDARADLDSAYRLSGRHRSDIQKLRDQLAARKTTDTDIDRDFATIQRDWVRYREMPDPILRLLSLLDVYRAVHDLPSRPSRLASDMLALQTEVEEEIRQGFETIIARLDAADADGLAGQAAVDYYQRLHDFVTRAEAEIGLKGERERRAKVRVAKGLLLAQARILVGAPPDQIISLYEQALALDPTDFRVRDRLSELWVQRELERIPSSVRRRPAQYANTLRELAAQPTLTRNIYLLLELVKAFTAETDYRRMRSPMYGKPARCWIPPIMPFWTI